MRKGEDMTDRLKGFIVMLDEDIREDDAQPILDAIRQIRHVQSVATMVSDADDWMARERVKIELKKKLYEALK